MGLGGPRPARSAVATTYAGRIPIEAEWVKPEGAVEAGAPLMKAEEEEAQGKDRG